MSRTALVRVKGLSIPPTEVDETIFVRIGPGTALCHLRHLHFFKANAFLVGLPLLSFIGPGIPDILAQKDARFWLLYYQVYFPVTGAFNYSCGTIVFLLRPLAV